MSGEGELRRAQCMSKMIEHNNVDVTICNSILATFIRIPRELRRGQVRKINIRLTCLPIASWMDPVFQLVSSRYYPSLF